MVLPITENNNLPSVEVDVVSSVEVDVVLSVEVDVLSVEVGVVPDVGVVVCAEKYQRYCQLQSEMSKVLDHFLGKKCGKLTFKTFDD